MTASSKTSSGKASNTSILLGRLCVWGGLVLFVAGLCWWLSTAANKPTGDSNLELSPEKPEALYVVAPDITNGSSPADVIPDEVPQDIAKNQAPAIPLGTVTTQSFNRVVTLADGTVTNLTHKNIFKNSMEQALSAAISPRGMAIPLRLAMRQYSDEQIRDMINTDVVIDRRNDSEAVIARKLEVQDMKEQMRELLKQGHSMNELFDELDSYAQNTRAEVTEARNGLAALLKDDAEPKAVFNYIDEKNQRLRELGQPEMVLPEIYKEALALEGDDENTEDSNDEDKGE